MTRLKTFLLAAAAALFSAQAQAGAVSDAVFTAMVDREVTIETAGGGVIGGTLIGAGADSVLIMLPDGKVMELDKDWVNVIYGGDARDDSGDGEAGACPWAGADAVRVHANMTTVYVNGEAFDVAGKYERSRFTDTLRACNADAAVKPYLTWRARRRGVNTGAIVMGVGAFVPYAGWGALAVEIVNVPIQAGAAGKRKREMERILESTTPPAR